MAANHAERDGKRKENPSRALWLRKHADYQRVYRESRRQSLPLMTYFFAKRTHVAVQNDTGFAPSELSGQPDAPSLETILPCSRVGLTAGKVLGNAVERNRIKRRMREAVRLHRMELTAGVDVILHPRRSVLEAEFPQIEREVVRAFRAVQLAMQARPASNITTASEEAALKKTHHAQPL